MEVEHERRGGGGKSKRGHSVSTFVYSEINRPCRTRYQRKSGWTENRKIYNTLGCIIGGNMQISTRRVLEWLLS